MEQMTNIFSWPTEIVNAILKDRYTVEEEAPFDFSATQILAPIQQTILKQRHKDNLKPFDISERFWAFMGSMAHSLLEEAFVAEHPEAFAEKRLYGTIEGMVVSGKADLYTNGEIRDYKFTKCYKYMKGGFDEWAAQLNVLAWLARQNNLPVKSLKIIAVFFDWKKHEAHKANYPSSQIVEIPFKLWDDDEVYQYLTRRIKALSRASGLSEEAIAKEYPCSDAECWQESLGFALIKQGNKKATKVFDSQGSALLYVEDNGIDMNSYAIIERKGEPRRCVDHCPASIRCQQNLLRLKSLED